MGPETGEAKYKRWLMDCVLIRGWSTLKCARMIDADPDEVRRDFEGYCAQNRNRYTRTNRFKLPPYRN